MPYFQRNLKVMERIACRRGRDTKQAQAGMSWCTQSVAKTRLLLRTSGARRTPSAPGKVGAQDQGPDAAPTQRCQEATPGDD
jgi:hypothetical protein